MYLDKSLVEAICSRALNSYEDLHSAKYTIENLFYEAKDYNKEGCPVDMNLVVLALVKCIQELNWKIRTISGDQI